MQSQTVQFPPAGKQVVEMLQRAMHSAKIAGTDQGLLMGHFANEWNAALAMPAPPTHQETRAAVTSDHDDAVVLLAAVFDAWEGGSPCYEDPDEAAGFLGMAFQLDDDIFQRCVELLNRVDPPRNAPAVPAPNNVGVGNAAVLPDVATGKLFGFTPEDLSDIADDLQSNFDQHVNAGNITGLGDYLLPTGPASAAKFIRAVLASCKPGR